MPPLDQAVDVISTVQLQTAASRTVTGARSGNIG